MNKENISPIQPKEDGEIPTTIHEDLDNMKIGMTTITQLERGRFVQILKVPGGFIYAFIDGNTEIELATVRSSVFVPLSK